MSLVLVVLAAMAVSGCNGFENPNPTLGTTSAADSGSATVIPAMSCTELVQSADGSMIVCDKRLVCKDGKAFESGWALLCASMLPSGIKGDTGATGAAGKDGAGCTTSMDSKNCVIVTCGTTISAPICGGVNGVDGTNGVDGKNGTNGTDGANGANGTDGKDGANGANGKNGTNGTNGTDGANGTNGSNGTNGKDGSSCSVATDPPSGCMVVFCTDGSFAGVCPGANGTNGTDGANGTNGSNGSNGKDAQPCNVSLSADGCKVSIICPLSNVTYSVPCGSADAGTTDTADAGSSDSSSADAGIDTSADITATDIAIPATGVDLQFTSPIAGVVIHVYHEADPAVDPFLITDSPMATPYFIHLSWVQACAYGLDGVDIAVYNPSANKWWCGVGDGTPSKALLTATVDTKPVTPTFVIRPGACLGGPEGNWHISRAQLGCK